MDDMAPRALPHDIQAEMGVLGSMMLSPDAIHLAQEQLAALDFYKMIHQDIFAAICKVFAEHGTVDLILLRNEMIRAKKLDKVGGAGYLQELMEAVPTSANVEYYAEIVLEHSQRRKVILEAGVLIRKAYESGENVEQVCAEIVGRLEAASEGAWSPKPMSEWIAEAEANLRMIHEGRTVGIQTGIEEFDRLTGGLKGGRFVVLAGWPSSGKTAIATNIARCAALEQGKHVMFFSAEMEGGDITTNLLRIMAGIDYSSMRRGSFEGQNLDYWLRASKEVAGAGTLVVDDSPSIFVETLQARAMKLNRRGKCDLVIVDHLQCLRTSLRENRNIQVGYIADTLHIIAREAHIPVLALSHLGRPTKDQKNSPKLPQWSSAIEQFADIILMVGRDKQAAREEGREPDPAIRIFLLQKHRHGPEGEWAMLFWKKYARFYPEGELPEKPKPMLADSGPQRDVPF